MTDSKKTIDLEQHKAGKIKNQIKDKFYHDMDKIREHEVHAKNRFLSAWKAGIKIVGPEFFVVKSKTIETATDKWQLEPNLEFMKNAMSVHSHGLQVLLGLMYSFYDSAEGQKLLEKANAANLVDALSVLDFESRDVVAELWLNYSGW